MTNLLESWFKIDLGEGAFYAVLGFAFVLVGILILVGIFTLLGFIMKKVNGRQPKTAERPASSAVKPQAQAQEEEGISPEVVAAITAALMCYYQKQNAKCDFVVRRIKRISEGDRHA